MLSALRRKKENLGGNGGLNAFLPVSDGHMRSTKERIDTKLGPFEGRAAHHPRPSCEPRQEEVPSMGDKEVRNRPHTFVSSRGLLWENYGS